MSAVTNTAQPYMIRVGQADDSRLEALSAMYNPQSLEWCKVNGVAQNASFLDVGCGNGGFTIPLAEAHPKMFCVGVDISQEQLDVAQGKSKRQGVSNIKWERCDVYHLADLRERYPALFDVVHSRFVLTHLSRPIEAIDAMMSMLKPGGLLLLEEFGTDVQYQVSHDSSAKALRAFAKLVGLQAQMQQSHKVNPEVVRNHLQGRVSELKIKLVNTKVDRAYTKNTFKMGVAQGIAKLAELNKSELIQTFGYECGDIWLQDMERFVTDDTQSVTVENVTFVMARQPT